MESESVIPAFPLCWPDIIPRSTRRERGAFKTTLAGALGNVETSLQRFGRDSGKPVKDIVLSSNCTLGVNQPRDPGVAAWFVWDGEQVCIPVDRYESAAANLQAIHHIIEARRVELRHGTLALVKASFRGFRALPDPSKRTWRQVLNIADGVNDLTVVVDAFRSRAAKVHPDKGGSHDAMAELNRAMQQAESELRT